jgi:broad specificity phosphatase PhoE
VKEVVIIRHGETEWTRTGRHTGTTDIELTPTGRRQAEQLGSLLTPRSFALSLTSPLGRAAETCRLAGYAGAEIRSDLAEWDYGTYDGRTVAQGSPRDDGRRDDRLDESAVVTTPRPRRRDHL